MIYLHFCSFKCDFLLCIGKDDSGDYIIPNKIFGLAQNSTRVVLDESRIQ